MKICDFMQQLYNDTENTPALYQKSCDTLKAGHPEQELAKVACSMFATPAVIRAAAEWGANLLIVHEPTFYDHWDDLSALETMPEPVKSVIQMKLKLIEESNLTIYRYHDHPHNRKPDYIAQGELAYWGLQGKFIQGQYHAVNNFVLDEPMPVMQLAETLEKNLGIQRIRIFGSTQTVCRKLALCFGTPGRLAEELLENDAVLTGEICEWSRGEFIRDYCGVTGKAKSILVMGHIGSERDGMKLLVDIIHKNYPQFEARYFECGESWSFTH